MADLVNSGGDPGGGVYLSWGGVPCLVVKPLRVVFRACVGGVGRGFGLSMARMMSPRRRAHRVAMSGPRRQPFGGWPLPQAPNHRGGNTPQAISLTGGPEPCPPRRATSPNVHTSELLNKVKAGCVEVPTQSMGKIGRVIVWN